ncbi:methyltransferase domain-containing protein [Heliorestis acidaminivorans]|uniref:Methyltransferase domain-containing protein n=1 Tax=Heliorestis acidaminivorans TaxID=553427 RepID=A0A6I0EWT0_9FIRM|nr:methyltransferase domain-containing protein [Heliorestis acidaminivorans]KAB2954259.1 methyltransferase domain-containing protein [Heliorestis acidaminivorans]
MTHKFSPINKSKLDNPWRREVLPSTSTLEKLGLTTNDTMADIGCGIGYFTIPAGQLVKQKNNKVYGLDILQEMLDEVEQKAKEVELANLITIKTEEYDLKLPNQSVTFALMVNVLHEVQDKNRMLQEVSRILQSAGKIAIIEFEAKEMEVGPPVHHRISKAETKDLLQKAGFDIIIEESFADVFYGLTALKK